MKLKTISILLFLMGLVLLTSKESQAQVELVNLRCEMLINPMGIDVKQPRLSWELESNDQDVKQTAYQIIVSSTLKKLSHNEGDLWNSGKILSDQSVHVAFQGKELKSMLQCYWKVKVWTDNQASEWSKPAFWEIGILEPETWQASWISKDQVKEKESKPCQYFRKEFLLSKTVKSARVYVTSLGLYQLFINGKKVGNDLFTPGWTSYQKRLQYQTYDVTSMLGKNNSVGAIIGDGWYRGRITYWGATANEKRFRYGDQLALLVQLQINYKDGTSEIVKTDNSWKSSTGPILVSDLYDGETYDARLEMPGWNQPDFNDDNWSKVSVLSKPKDILVAPQGFPVKAIQEIKPVKLFTTPKGETVFDMGQNMVGWIRLKVRGKKGETVRLRFAEVLDKAGNFYTDNLRSAKCTDMYILKGEGEEIYEPYFTFHGFRFVKVEGLTVIPSMDQITGVVIHSDMPRTGTFVCSDTLINQLQQNIQWGQKGNFLDVPTDCPQRDERLGWTGDAQVFCQTAAFNYNVGPFFTKWLKDLAADQLPDGSVTNIVPDFKDGRGGAAAWGDAAVIIPWTMYLSYGDKQILENQYQSMKGWVEYMKGWAGENNLWTGDKLNTGYQQWGDWLAYATTRSDYPGATTEKGLIATAYYYYSASLLSKAAGIIGEKIDAEKYSALAKNIKTAFISEFVTPNGRLVSHTQTAYALAISFGLLPDELVSNVARYLAEDVKSFGHLTTGFVGTPLICKSLSDVGYQDLAFMLLTRKQYPSWLYPVTQGATTIWERWDGQKPDGTFQTTTMNSFNHYAYGAIGEWLYNYVAGICIDPQNPGYKHFILNPHPGGGLDSVRADFLSVYGKIRSTWKFEENDFVYEVTIPANTTATVRLPQTKPDQLKVYSLLSNVEISKKIETKDNSVEINLGSGKYRFQYPASGLNPRH